MEDCQRIADRRPGMMYPVAMAYVPWQQWYTVYDLEKGLTCGTIFPELDKPFRGVRGGCR